MNFTIIDETNVREILEDKRTVIFLSILFISLTIGLLTRQSALLEDKNQVMPFGPSHDPPKSSVNVTYSPENETATITVTRTEGFNKSNTEKLTIKSVPANETASTYATIKAERKSTKGTWAAQNQTSAADLPIKKGSKVKILEDGTDADNDNKTGIDGNTDIEVLFTETGKTSKEPIYRKEPVMSFKIKNNTVIITPPFRAAFNIGNTRKKP